VVRPLAERLRHDGLKVWFDEWVLKPGDSIPAKIEAGREHSRVLPLAHRMGEGARRAGEGCLSAQAVVSDWARLEAGTCGRRNLRFHNRLNQERRLAPVRFDDASPNGARSSSPRLAPRAYLAFPSRTLNNPNGASSLDRIVRPQPRWGGGFFARRIPRVGRSSQPWALRRSPIGPDCGPVRNRT
jgi:hypothetical protein